MAHLSLRLRVFLFFCLIACGGVVVTGLALWLGYRQLGEAQAFSAFMTSGTVAGMGVVGLALFVWLLFDENVSKPIEAMAAGLRVRTHADVTGAFDANTAKYLGDLAPAASALQEKLSQTSRATHETVEQQTARLKLQQRQLIQILSDLPVAVIVVGKDHRIVLYDGQAAALMEREAPARLGCSVFDYLHEASVRAVLADMATKESLHREIAIKGKSGAVYSGHMRRFGADVGYTLMLQPLDPGAARPLVYDFDLLDKPVPAMVGDADLRDLSFVVFDSETTGLDPIRDAVVQLGAVRVVNGKLVEGEQFDTLVNPGRPIPPSSTKVHKIDDGMVSGAPDIAQATRQFHQFANGSVMIAHNAPFDLAFLHRQTKQGGPSFDNPVLDTVHLSAIVFGGSAEHTLDALSERLDIQIPPDLRHSALGDAIATAQVFVAMLPILEARGLTRFDQIKREMKKHSRILRVQD